MELLKADWGEAIFPKDVFVGKPKRMMSLQMVPGQLKCFTGTTVNLVLVRMKFVVPRSHHVLHSKANRHVKQHAQLILLVYRMHLRLRTRTANYLRRVPHRMRIWLHRDGCLGKRSKLYQVFFI